jgi:hypothetical protein
MLGMKNGPSWSDDNTGPALALAAFFQLQGLTLVHFSYQTEPFLSLKPTETTQRIPQKLLR